MPLTGSQFQQLQQALLSAFPTHPALAHMVLFGLHQNLDTTTGTGTLADVVFQLITWAKAQGRTEELVANAQKANPGNEAMHAFAVGFLKQTGSQQIEAGKQPSIGIPTDAYAKPVRYSGII